MLASKNFRYPHCKQFVVSEDVRDNIVNIVNRCSDLNFWYTSKTTSSVKKFAFYHAYLFPDFLNFGNIIYSFLYLLLHFHRHNPWCSVHFPTASRNDYRERCFLHVFTGKQLQYQNVNCYNFVINLNISKQQQLYTIIYEVTH